jgi:uncharacterized membrane protein
MREGKIVAISVIILFVIGCLNIYASIFLFQDFNFDKSEITINGNNVQEKLTYNTNKEYHTLYRTFITPLAIDNSSSENIQITSVECPQGTPYVYTGDYQFYTYENSFQLSNPLPYTETNEYGCTFGDTYGFKKSQEYYIKSSFIVNNQNLFLIKGKYYTKFVVYSPNEHKLLIKGKNLIISGNQDIITQNIFPPSHYVIIYIPYKEWDISQYTIIQKNNFEFDNNYLIFIMFIPILLVLFVWFFFGRENNPLDVPHELSMYPNERKGWELASIFNPPFGGINTNFFPAITLDLYRKKVIDMKTVGDDSHIKIKDYSNKKLDEIELAFIKYIETIRDLGGKEFIDNAGFIDIDKAVKSINSNFSAWKSGWATNIKELQESYKELNKLIKNQSKSYIDHTGNIIIMILLGCYTLLSLMFISDINFFSVLSFMLPVAFIIYITYFSSTFIKFKGNYYQEYQKWQAFKHYLKSFSSMRTCPPEAIKLWQQHLVYATGLGVGAIVIKKFKDWKVIDSNQYKTYHAVYGSSAIGHSAGASHGGGMGGAGGGGAGGGGGGGR